MPIFLKLRQKKARSKPTSPFRRIVFLDKTKKNTSSAFIIHGGGAVVGYENKKD